VLVQHSSWASIPTATGLDSHLLVINHFWLQALIYHMRLVLLLSERSVRHLSHILLFLRAAGGLTGSVIEGGHGPTRVAGSLIPHNLLLHCVGKATPDAASAIVDHGLTVGL
jgi:hypothetical protein